ncbi:lantibiotic dehydratase [Streptomyces sp. NPDC090022]|uniref:lantibiotic dehydratase n=1 Tax=Streptomyces sp. NPDC090022 TaxID=3365920 RepID=UPI003825A1E6
MPHSAAPRAAAPGDQGPAPTRYRVCGSPFALARATVLRHPAQSPSAVDFRAALDGLTSLWATESELLPGLCDALYDSRDGHDRAFHQGVVLPLRRALHNGRPPQPALLERLGDLPHRVPKLAAWLTLREQRAALYAALERAAGPALTAERTALSALCREPALARAVALISPDLLRAVTRAGAGAADRRARKEEPGVLRYALRASTKTSPLSWFTAVAWAHTPEPTAASPADPADPAHAVAGGAAAADLATAAWGDGGPGGMPFTSVVRANRALVTALVAALVADPARRAALLLRMTSTARIRDGRAAHTGGRLVFTGGRHLTTTEEEIELAASAPLRLIAAATDTPSSLGELTGRLNAALGRPTGEPAAETEGGGAAAAFLLRLLDAGLLVPTDPVDPHHADPLTALAAWLRATSPTTGEPAAAAAAPAGAPAPGAELADLVEEIARDTAAFASLPAPERPAALTALAARWDTLLTAAGRPVPTATARPDVLSEDVVAPAPLDLDGLLGPADHAALAEVTALAEVFDLGHVMRRVTRDRFVARYGAGGTCPNPWEFGAEIAEAWEEAARLTAAAPGTPGTGPAGLTELAALRRTVTDAVRESATGAPGAYDVTLPAGLVRGLGSRLPGWARRRPASYAYFVQRDTADGLLCVNHVYGGWGRFTSRFLDAMDPGAAAEVAARIRAGLGERARAAAVRPVGGFNANLHPLLVPDEIGPDRRWTSLAESDVDLVHDPVGDDVRLRLRTTGELLDVLYLGFLAPVMLPHRLAPYLSDHPCGVVDFSALVPARTLPAPGGHVVRTARLRHRHLVLRRRRWYLDAGVLARLRAELAADDAGLPAAAVARWRALLDLPDQLFLCPAPVVAPSGKAADTFLAGLRRPKPQFLDLGNALHLRCLGKWLARHTDGAVLEEALPAPGGRDRPARAVELVVETYREGSPT